MSIGTANAGSLRVGRNNKQVSDFRLYALQESSAPTRKNEVAHRLELGAVLSLEIPFQRFEVLDLLQIRLRR